MKLALKRFFAWFRPLRVGADGWLKGKVIKIPTHPTRLPKFFAGPYAIVWHYTATPGGARVMAERRVAPRDRSNHKDVTTSWHFTIDRDGALYQMVPIDRGAYHCRDGAIDGVRPNNCTIGVELVGRGDSFTPEQVLTARWLILALGLKRHYGHAYLDLHGKEDPGPVWARLMHEMPECDGHELRLG